jgi:hypothetical protein
LTASIGTIFDFFRGGMRRRRFDGMRSKSPAGLAREAVINRNNAGFGWARLFSLAAPGAILLGGLFLLTGSGKAENEVLRKQGAELQARAKTLEQNATDRDARTANLETEKKDLSARILESREAVAGNSHWQIALDALMKQRNVPAAAAGTLLGQTALFDKIQAGNQIWNCFQDGVLGTFLTKGEAAVSPAQLRQKERIAREEEKKPDHPGDRGPAAGERRRP